MRRQLTASIRNWVNFDLVYVDPNLMCVMYTWTTSTFILALTLLWQLTCNKHKVNFDLVQVNPCLMCVTCTWTQVTCVVAGRRVSEVLAKVTDAVAAAVASGSSGSQRSCLMFSKLEGGE